MLHTSGLRGRAFTWAPGVVGLGTVLLVVALTNVAQPAVPNFDVEQSASAAPVAVAVAPPARETRADTWQLVEAGIPAPLASGDELAVAGDLSARISFSRGVERYGRVIELELHGSGDAPAAAGSIVARGHMRFMDHGAFRAAATSSGDGHYTLPLVFAMPGDWQIDLDIATTADRGTLLLDLDLID